MKIFKKIDNIIGKLFVIPLLIQDKIVPHSSWRIFRYYLDLYEPDNKDKRFRKLVTFCLYKGLSIMIKTAIIGQYPRLNYELPTNLYSVTGKKFSDYLYDNISKEWIRDKWYNDIDSVPIVINTNKKKIVIDGNHRLCQQIYHNEIRFIMIDVVGSWLHVLLTYYKIRRLDYDSDANIRSSR